MTRNVELLFLYFLAISETLILGLLKASFISLLRPCLNAWITNAFSYSVACLFLCYIESFKFQCSSYLSLCFCCLCFYSLIQTNQCLCKQLINSVGHTQKEDTKGEGKGNLLRRRMSLGEGKVREDDGVTMTKILCIHVWNCQRMKNPFWLLSLMLPMREPYLSSVALGYFFLCLASDFLV